MPTVGYWSRPGHGWQDPEPDGLAVRVAGGRTGGLQRHHYADGRGDLLRAGDLRQQHVILRGCEEVRTGLQLRTLCRLAWTVAGVNEQDVSLRGADRLRTTTH